MISRPRHPYTKALVSVIPVPEAGHVAEQIVLTGETPSPTEIPTGCRFAPRCWLRRELGNPEDCSTRDPRLELAAGAAAEHGAACHFTDTRADRGSDNEGGP